MNPDLEGNLGEQPIARIMREHNLKPHDLVALSSVEMTDNLGQCPRHCHAGGPRCQWITVGP